MYPNEVYYQPKKEIEEQSTCRSNSTGEMPELGVGEWDDSTIESYDKLDAASNETDDELRNVKNEMEIIAPAKLIRMEGRR